MKTLIVIVIALALGTLLAVFAIDDPGVVVLARAPHRIELPMWFFAVIVAAVFAVMYLLFNFLFGFFAAPKKIKNWNAGRRNKKAQANTLRGYAKLIEGDWHIGEKHLTRRLKESKTPLLNYLGAAYAAQQQEDFQKRDHYLDKAEAIDPSNRMAVDLTRARLLAQASQYDEAKSLLETMHPLAPANKTILRLMADVYRQSGDMGALAGVLPKLEKTRALPAEQCADLDVLCRAEGGDLALTDQSSGSDQTGADQWLREWKSLPSTKQKNPAMAALYAKRLINAGGLEQAEKLLHKALKKKWDSDLVVLYGLTRSKNLAKQIKFANTWLIMHEDDANVHLTLARLNMAFEPSDQEHISKAEAHYQKSIQLGALDEAFYELGQYYEAQNDRKAALALYKKGVQTSIALHSVDTLSSDEPPSLELGSVITMGASDMTPLEILEGGENSIEEASDAELVDESEKKGDADSELVESK